MDAQAWPIATMAACIATTLISLGPLSLIGQRSIVQWIDLKTASQLARLPWLWWWVAAISAALLWWAVPVQAESRPHLLVPVAILVGLLASLLTLLTRIDLVCRLLPDRLTGLLIVSGLLSRGLGGPPSGISVIDGIAGALLGYGLLWLIARFFKKLRAKEAMGRGDFAMSAGLGAWMGWQSIPAIWLVASISGIILALIGRGQRRIHQAELAPRAPVALLKTEIPFGPCLAFGALVIWVQLG